MGVVPTFAVEHSTPVHIFQPAALSSGHFRRNLAGFTQEQRDLVETN